MNSSLQNATKDAIKRGIVWPCPKKLAPLNFFSSHLAARWPRERSEPWSCLQLQGSKRSRGHRAARWEKKKIKHANFLGHGQKMPRFVKLFSFRCLILVLILIIFCDILATTYFRQPSKLMAFHHVLSYFHVIYYCKSDHIKFGFPGGSVFDLSHMGGTFMLHK